MDLDKILAVNCSNVQDIITVEEIAAINMKITDSERYNNYIVEESQFDKSLSTFLDSTREVSEEYSDQHENDRYATSQIETLQNLLVTEFYYKCRENNDLIYLSAVLMHRIADGHPFEDGNKRTGYVAGCIFIMNYIQVTQNPPTVPYPELDKDLLNSLEDIAKEDEQMRPKELASVYRKSVRNELKEILSD
jgi:death-on-curing family protein